MIKLSPTGLTLYLECPRCFWLTMNEKIKRPTGIFPSLPGGIDLLIKKYFDSYRAKGLLPPEIDGRVEGRLLDDEELLKKWRNWRVGLSFEDNALDVAFRGALDDCLMDSGIYIPVDYKTRGYDLKEDTVDLYQNQIDSYVLLLEKNGYKTPSFGYLVFYIPREIKSDGMIRFSVETLRVGADPNRAYAVLRDATQTVLGPIPSAHTKCAFCSWLHNIASLEI